MQTKSSSGLIGQRQERISKAAKLRELGIDPYPSKTARDNYTGDVLQKFADLESTKVTLAGRVMSWRRHGKVVFADIQDPKGRLQLFIREDTLGETNSAEQSIGFAELNLLDIGDIIEAYGEVVKTRTGEISLAVEKIKLLTKAIRPLPEKWTGLKDKEILFRQRYLDLIINPEKKWRFEATAKITFAIREFLNSKGFLEIKTPIIQPVYGGTNANPFKTHVRALDVDYYMAISHELYLKRLIVAGFENVYNLCGYFRNEGIDRSHNPEFSMIETMTAYKNYEYNMNLTEEMYRYIAEKVFNKTTFKISGQDVDFAKPWERISMTNAVKKYSGYDFETVKTLEDAHKILAEINVDERPNSIGESMVLVFEEKVEANLIQPTFVYGHPVEISPLAKTTPEDKRFVERFEIFIGGIEGGDNWTELNDPVELYERFKGQVAKGRGGDDEAHPMDVEFLEAMEYGLPPTTGLGPGVERLAMMFTETDYIDDVIFFPMMKPAPVTEIQKQIYGEEYVMSEIVNKARKSDKSVDLSRLEQLQLATIDSAVAEKYPGIKFGYITVSGVSVDKADEILTDTKKAIIDQTRKEFKDKAEVKTHKNIAGFREIYKKFGADPSTRMNSSEALLSRVLSGKGIYNVNNVVDTYNLTSVELKLPMAAYDLDQVQGQITLREAKNGESIVKIGDSDETEIEAGELVYADELGVTCMDFNYRDADRTKVTNATKNLIVFVDGHGQISKDELDTALQLLTARLEAHTGGKVTGIGYSNAASKPVLTQATESNNINVMLPTHEEANKLLEEHVKDDYQRLHAKMVGTALQEYAKKYGEDENLWYLTGLLHDLDYYEHPEEHPKVSLEWFKDWGYSEELIHAVAAHAHDRTGVEPETKLAKALLATDEMSGLIYAYWVMRPEGFKGMEIKSVKKKFKDKAFAAKIDREEIQLGMDKLGVDFAEHAETLIQAFSKLSELNK